MGVGLIKGIAKPSGNLISLGRGAKGLVSVWAGVVFRHCLHCSCPHPQLMMGYLKWEVWVGLPECPEILIIKLKSCGAKSPGQVTDDLSILQECWCCVRKLLNEDV